MSDGIIDRKGHRQVKDVLIGFDQQPISDKIPFDLDLDLGLLDLDGDFGSVEESCLVDLCY